MKRRTLFLAEMTNRELEIFLEDYKTVLIPVGSTEQHGPHSP
ncbi:MAG: creatininase family protein, partial [Deltaproteobacteria bacterium]